MRISISSSAGSKEFSNNGRHLAGQNLIVEAVRLAWNTRKSDADKRMLEQEIEVDVELFIANISDWLEENGCKIPEGVTYWRQFRITKVHGRTAIQARHNTVNARWGNICADEAHDGLYSYAFPDGDVPHLKPDTKVPPSQTHIMDGKGSMGASLGHRASDVLAPLLSFSVIYQW